MDEATIQDFKQFFAAIFSQERESLYTDLRRDLRADIREDLKVLEDKIDTVDRKIDTISACIAEAMDDSNDEVNIQLKKHHFRITRLEAKAGFGKG